MADVDDIAELLLVDHGTRTDTDGRSLVVVDPAKGDPAATVLRVLGLGHSASPVGAAAHGPAGVSIGVWRAPHLYLARWTAGARRVTAYRVAMGAKLSDYLRTEGRIPTHLETGNWYGAVPEEIEEAFLEVGMLVDEPPFPVPAPPPPPPPPPAPASRRTSTPRAPKPAPTPKPRAARPPPIRRPERPSTTRLCPACHLHKSLQQFAPGSDLCVDCA